MKNKLIKAQFSLDNYDEAFEGYHNPDVNWNGWAVPYFTWEEGKRMSAVMEDLHYIANDSFIWCTDGEDQDVFDPEVLSTQDGRLKLYPIGSQYWTWGVNQKLTDVVNSINNSKNK